MTQIEERMKLVEGLGFGSDQIKQVMPILGAEGPLLYLLAVNSTPLAPVAVEIGGYTGTSTCMLGSLVRQRGGIYFTIDNYTEYGTLDPTARVHMQNMMRCGIEDSIIRIFGDSHTLPWPDLLIDLLFIDGDHSFDSVTLDCERWLPRVRAGGIVLFHDYDFTTTVRPIADKFCSGWVKLGEDTKCGLFRKP